MFLEKKISEKIDNKIGMRIAVIALLILQLIVLFCYGNRKSGFHEDEFYSYYSTNKTAGLFVDDRQWQARDNFRNDFVVLEGEQFRYDVVKQMQSWDVHPPLYYYLLHTVCSLFPGVFSKWLGISVNLVGFVLSFFLLFYLVWSCIRTGDSDIRDVRQEQRNPLRAWYFAFAVCLFWGFSAAVVSGVMFIRMYQWLTVFVLACACLHIKALKEEKFGSSFFIPLGIVVFLGFLTQYYYIIFHFFLGLSSCFLLLRRKKIKQLLLYGVSCMAGFGCAVIYYPASLSHIFRGYRGTEAVSEFSDVENTWDRLQFFVGLFDDYIMNGTLSIFLLAICLLWITISYKRKQKAVVEKACATAMKENGYPAAQLVGVLLFASLGYFFTVSKTALLLGETSNRYQLPIYGILIFLIMYYLLVPIERFAKDRDVKIPAVLFLTVLLLLDVMALRENKVFFLYEEEAPMMEVVKENEETSVIVFYNEASADHVWWISDQLMEFSEVYFASQGNADLITDPIITESEKLLVYVADYEDPKKCLENLLVCNKQLTGYNEIGKKKLWTLYEVE